MTALQILIALFSISLAGLAGIMFYPTKKHRQTYGMKYDNDNSLKG